MPFGSVTSRASWESPCYTFARSGNESNRLRNMTEAAADDSGGEGANKQLPTTEGMRTKPTAVGDRGGTA